MGFQVIKYCMRGIVDVSLLTLAAPVGLLNKQFICLFIFMLFHKFHWRALKKKKRTSYIKSWQNILFLAVLSNTKGSKQFCFYEIRESLVVTVILQI
jgi:hypothetical protein